jgi:hypothetical protein
MAKNHKDKCFENPNLPCLQTELFQHLIYINISIDYMLQIPTGYSKQLRLNILEILIWYRITDIYPSLLHGTSLQEVLPSIKNKHLKANAKYEDQHCIRDMMRKEFNCRAKLMKVKLAYKCHSSHLNQKITMTTFLSMIWFQQFLAFLTETVSRCLRQ